MNTNVTRRLSDSSTNSINHKNVEDMRACRHIETVFSQECMPESVYGNKFFLPAQIIYESRDGCAMNNNKRTEGWAKRN